LELQKMSTNVTLDLSPFITKFVRCGGGAANRTDTIIDEK